MTIETLRFNIDTSAAIEKLDAFASAVERATVAMKALGEAYEDVGETPMALSVVADLDRGARRTGHLFRA